MITLTLKRVLLAVSMCCLAATANAATLPEAISYFQSKQYDKSLPIFLASSEQGDTKSQSYLARIYVNGLGVEKNNTTALYWASRAAAKNDPISLGIMGYLYLNGEGGVIKDPVRALSYYRKAADQDNAIAVERYAQVLFSGHSKKDLDKIESDLAKDKSLSSSLVLMKLYSDTHYKPSNLYKAMPHAFDAIKRGSSSAIWLIVENGNYIQLPDVLKAGWLKLLQDLKDPDMERIDNYQQELKEAIESLQPGQIAEVDSLTIPILISKTSVFLKERDKKYGPIETADLIGEGWIQFIGKRGRVNEPFAQLLLEEGLRRAIATRQIQLANLARNNLGVVLGASVNPQVRNKRLAQVHIIDGADSEYGPDNLIWYDYEGKIDLPSDQLQSLLSRYKESENESHILEILGSLPPEYKNKPDFIIQYLIKKFEEKPDYQIAMQIADMYEDNYTDISYLKEAVKWYLTGTKLKGEDVDERLSRINKILAGDYVKDIPNLRNSIENLYEINSATTTHLKVHNSALKNSAPSGKRKLYALVVGNSQYQSGRLGNAINDARLMAEKLRGFGFNVSYATDLNRKLFLTTLMNFSDKAKDADVTVFYYSGHGMQLGGVNYLLPIDIDFKSKEDIVAIDGVSLNDAIRRNIPGKSKIVFLDACRTKPFQYASEGYANHGLAPMNVPRGTLISFATKDGGVAFDGPEGKNSPYTSALATLIGENEDIAILLRNVRDNVLKVTQGKQEPWEYGSLSGGRLILSSISTQ